MVDPVSGPEGSLVGTLDLGIVVRDAPAMLSFYRDVLALSYLQAVTVADGTLHVLRFGRGVLKLLEPTTPLPASALAEGISAAGGLRYWGTTVQGLDALVERCTTEGGSLLSAARDTGGGDRYAVVRDPDGNAIELIERGSGPGARG